MTTEDKLKSFLDTSIEAAKKQSEKMISEYTAALDRIFKEHQADVSRKTALRLKTEKDRQNREKNKELAARQIAIKHEITKKEKALTDMIFAEVEDMLTDYMKTPEYKELLINQIKEAADFAAGEPMTIYIDPADEPLRTSLENAVEMEILLNPESFKGGTKIILTNKNILIDNSFEQKLEEAREGFTLGGKQRR